MLKKIENIETCQEEKEIVDKISNLEKIIFPESFYSQNQLLDMSKSENYSIYVYAKQKDILGYLIIHDSLDCYEIMKIGVTKSQRKKGIGNRLLNYFLEDIDKNILLEVRESNVSAIKFYKQKGFNEIGIRKNYYQNNGENALIMQLEK